MKPSLVISLDFELFWGMSDKTTLTEYGENVRGVREAIPRMLELFEKHNIRATWATVGMLAFESRQELFAALPSKRPAYKDPRLSAYTHLYGNEVGENEQTDVYHFGPSLIRQITAVPGQEIGSHTFSHYYCKEDGQDAETFRADLEAAATVLSQYAPRPISLVLPRNQWREEYLPIAKETGIRVFRGNQESAIYAARAEHAQTNPVVRALRLIDQYVPLFGSHTAHAKDVAGVMNVPASMFLRPFSWALRALEPLRRERMKAAMTAAAKSGGIFHLWWHPHNFGKNVDENIATLAELLTHYDSLKEQYGMESKNMGDFAV